MAQDKTVIEKNLPMTLKVTKVYDEETVGRNNTPKLNFMATSELPYDESFRYSTFAKSLFDAIKAAEGGEGLKCEVEISTHPHQGQTYEDRMVNQAFDKDGKGLRSTGGGSGGYSGGGSGGYSGGGGGRAWQPDPPDKVASIEAQSTFYAVSTVIAAGKLALDSPLGKAWEKWGLMSFTMSTAFRANVITSAAAKPKTLVEEAKAAGAVEGTPDEIEWDDKPTIDPEGLKQLMLESKWSAATVRSYCVSIFKTAADGSALNDKLDVIPFIQSMTMDNIKALFAHMESRRQG